MDGWVTCLEGNGHHDGGRPADTQQGMVPVGLSVHRLGHARYANKNAAQICKHCVIMKTCVHGLPVNLYVWAFMGIPVSFNSGLTACQWLDLDSTWIWHLVAWLI